MGDAHDRGGWKEGPIDTSVHPTLDWEMETAGLTLAVVNKHIFNFDEFRRAIEQLPNDEYEALSYFERHSFGLEMMLIEKGLLTPEEIDQVAAELDPPSE